MRLTDRDIEIINFVEEFQGATIEHLHLMFFPSYDMAKKRLKKLQDCKFLKAEIHPVTGTKVYYKKRLPSYHTLMLNTVYVMRKDCIAKFVREFKIADYKADGLIVTKSKRVFLIEIDIFNKTSKNKIKNMKERMNREIKQDITCIVITRQARRSVDGWVEIRESEIEKINKYII